MLGALIGDLAASAWEEDPENFFSKLIDLNFKPSPYGFAIMNAASRNLLSNQKTPVDPVGKPGTVTYSGEWLMWHIVSAWIDDREIRDLPNFYSLDKAEYYARHFMVNLIHELRKGASKSEAFHRVSNFEQLIKNKNWNWKSDIMSDGNDILTYVFRAWDSFYRGFDYTSSIQNAMRWSGDKHLLGTLTGAFAEAMYGCRYNLIKRKFNTDNKPMVCFNVLMSGEMYGYHHGLIMEMGNISSFGRSFFPKNEAETNVEFHHWVPVFNVFRDLIFTEEEHKKIMISAPTNWDCRYGFYLDDGWHYIYRSRVLISRFKMKFDGSFWRITNWELSGEVDYRESINAFENSLYGGCRIINRRIEFLAYYVLECKYFKGEEEMPVKWENTVEGKFWHGEIMFLTSIQDDKPFKDLAKSCLKRLVGPKKKSFMKYSDAQRAMICYIETLYRKWCPYDDMDWIYGY